MATNKQTLSDWNTCAYLSLECRCKTWALIYCNILDPPIFFSRLNRDMKYLT